LKFIKGTGKKSEPLSISSWFVLDPLLTLFFWSIDLLTSLEERWDLGRYYDPNLEFLPWFLIFYLFGLCEVLGFYAISSFFVYSVSSNSLGLWLTNEVSETSASTISSPCYFLSLASIILSVSGGYIRLLIFGFIIFLWSINVVVGDVRSSSKFFVEFLSMFNLRFLFTLTFTYFLSFDLVY